MNELESKSILHQIKTERVENGIVKDCLSQLELANRYLKKEIKLTGSIYTKARYREIRDYLKKVAKELKKNVNDSMTIEDFIEYEMKSQEKLLKKYGNINMTLPSKEQIISSATFTPYTDFSTFESFLDSLESDFFNMWDSTVRAGYLTGQTTDQIVSKVMGYGAKNSQVAQYGLVQTLRNSIERNTRTALQSFAMETRKMIYDKNDELFDGYRWVATLDRRTCILCGENENKIYRKLTDFENPPLHYNCRCTIIPIIKDLEDLDEEDTRASMNEQVDSKITFEQWLKEQTPEVQEDVLGKTRYKMFKEGATLSEFVSDNRVLRLSELEI